MAAGIGQGPGRSGFVRSGLAWRGSETLCSWGTSAPQQVECACESFTIICPPTHAPSKVFRATAASRPSYYSSPRIHGRMVLEMSPSGSAGPSHPPHLPVSKEKPGSIRRQEPA